ncbi:MAG: MFS transporter [Candidatus Humimicrobiaceae bacterium]
MKKDNILNYLAEFPNFLSLFMFSFFLFAPSPILIEISGSLGIKPAAFSLVFTFFTVGLIIGQLTANLYDKFLKRIRIVIIFYVFLIILSAFLYFANMLWIFYLLYFFAGYSMGVIYIKANEYILESQVKNRARILTIAITFFPIGALLTPIISVFIVNSGYDWRSIYFVAIAFLILVLISYIFITKNRKYISSGKNSKKMPAKKIFSNKRRNWLFVATCLAILFYAIAETVISTWSPTFFRESKSLGLVTAGLIVTIFWIVVIVGRLVTSYFSGKISSLNIIFFLSIIGTLSLFFAVFLEAKTFILVSIAFTGLGFSGIFPLLVYYGSNIYEGHSNYFLPFLFVSGTIGNALAPYLTNITSGYSMFFSMFLSVIFMAATLFLVILQLIIHKKIN